MQNIVSILKKRGFIDGVSHDELYKMDKPFTIYCGFDPTGDSLHIGHLVAIVGMSWFKKAGHKVIAIAGGATGMIGDPSGKNKERNLLDEDTIAKNLIGISGDLKKILGDDVSLLNNYDWFKNFSFVSFLREVGKQFRMGIMLSKDSVKSRLASEEGMSFTEFCYQILQAYDFLYLNEKHNVNLQIGGADQWGNITAGIELIRKVKGEEVYGITFTLLTKADGQKFGKSEKGAVWLNPEKLSPYEFYQYLIRTDDRDVIKLLKLLTFIDLEEISEIESRLMKGEVGVAQKRLAQEVTLMVHGQAGLDAAIKTTELAQPGHAVALNEETFKVLENELEPFTFNPQAIGSKWVDIIAELKILASKGDVKRLIKNNGLLINNEKLTKEDALFEPTQLIAGRYVLVSVGKKTKYLLKLKQD